MPDRIELRGGACGWLAQLQWVVATVAAILLLTLSTPWHWKLATWAALSFVYGFLLRHNTQRHPPSRLLMRLDGTLLLLNAGVELDGVVEGAWVSRWLCVIHWTATGDNRRQHSLVCASDNTPDDFRRLLVLLRLGTRPSRGALSW
jgi:hypothetical protein